MAIYSIYMMSQNCLFLGRLQQTKIRIGTYQFLMQNIKNVD